MEQAYSDVCMPLCLEESPVNRLAQSCRAAAIEMPRPTVRRWCEHGYSTAFQKANRELEKYFRGYGNKNDLEEHQVHEQKHQEPESVTSSSSDTGDLKIIATIPITIDDKSNDLFIYEGQSAEDAVVVFCRQHMSEDVSNCIRQLLPNVMERYEAAVKSN